MVSMVICRSRRISKRRAFRFECVTCSSTCHCERERATFSAKKRGPILPCACGAEREGWLGKCWDRRRPVWVWYAPWSRRGFARPCRSTHSCAATPNLGSWRLAVETGSPQQKRLRARRTGSRRRGCGRWARRRLPKLKAEFHCVRDAVVMCGVKIGAQVSARSPEVPVSPVARLSGLPRRNNTRLPCVLAAPSLRSRSNVRHHTHAPTSLSPEGALACSSPALLLLLPVLDAHSTPSSLTEWKFSPGAMRPPTTGREAPVQLGTKL